MSNALKIAGALGGAAGGATDPNFSNVSLLLHGDGTNGAQNNTFVDSSTNNFTITRNGNTTQGSLTPFGTKWSNYFDGTGDYLSVADNAALDLSGDFTIECWVYWVKRSGETYPRIFTKGDYQASTSAWLITVTSSTGVTEFSYGNPNVTKNIGTMVANTWNHIAICRSGSTLSTYLNGTRSVNDTVSTDFTSTHEVRIGAGSLATVNELFTGNVSNARIVKGTAAYSGATITVPTSPLTAITNTSLLTCQSNTLKDNSSNNFTITKNGDVSVSKESPFGADDGTGGSGYFDGAGDYLSLTLGAATGTTFTVEAWVYISSYPSAGQTYGIASTTTQATTPEGWRIRIDTSGVGQFGETWGANNFNSDSVIPLNQWVHIAGVRNGSGAANATLYINGVKQTNTGTFNKTYTSTAMVVGRTYTGNDTEYMRGYMSNVRVSSTARYSATFTPTTVPFSSDGSTTLLLNFTNAGITDSARKANLETVGNAQVSTSVVKYGTGSMYFDGTGDWLTSPDSTNLKLDTGAFTIECFVRLAATGAARGIVGKGSGTTGCLLSTNASNQVVFTDTTTAITSTGALAGTTWYHIAVVREGTGSNQTKIYIDGVNDGTGTSATNFNQTNIMYIGANRTGGDALNGHIDELRITKGVARYTANFTPPTAPFPNT